MDERSRIITSPTPFPELVERGPSFIRRNINAPIDNFLAFFRGRDNDSYCSGSFEFDPAMQYNPIGTGTPDMFNRPLIHMYNTMCNFCYALPHAARWVVFIEPHNQEYLLSEMKKVRQYEPTRSSEDWNFDEASKYLVRDEAQKTIGCIFALGVSQSGIGVGVGNFGGAGGVVNGFKKAPVTQGRVDDTPLEITVKETNCSYTDFFLHPWTMLVGHKGLFARDKSKSIKADITIFELAPTFPKQTPIVRKVFKYHDCAPININAENLNYEQDRVIQRQIQFAYNFYTIQDGAGFGADSAVDERRDYGFEQSYGRNNVYGAVDQNGK